MSYKQQDWADLEEEQQSAEGQSLATKEVPPDITFDDCILTSEEIKEIDIPKRPKLAGDWFKEGDLGFVFAPPGRGKSWFSMYLASCLSNNKPFGPWECPEHCKVLYVEGEMGLEAIKDRGIRLADKGVQYLTYESVLDKKDTPLNLADVRQQKALLNACKDRGCNIIFIDNLSCLFSGVKENEADSWEMVLPWFLMFRRIRSEQCRKRDITAQRQHNKERNNRHAKTKHRRPHTKRCVQAKPADRRGNRATDH